MTPDDSPAVAAVRSAISALAIGPWFADRSKEELRELDTIRLRLRALLRSLKGPIRTAPASSPPPSIELLAARVSALEGRAEAVDRELNARLDAIREELREAEAAGDAGDAAIRDELDARLDAVSRGFAGNVDAGNELIADARSEIWELRSAIDDLRDRFSGRLADAEIP